MKKLFVIVALFIAKGTFAQALTTEQYIAKYKDLAIREMKRMGVPAAIKLAQGILETESGNSALVKKSNNHFGIKCKSSWTANGVSHDDDAPGECFRVYDNAEASYRDHSNFLRGSDRYAFLFRYDPTDYKSWAYGLKQAGYATNPKYPAILIKYIEQYDLQQYSIEGAKGMIKVDGGKYSDDSYQKFVFDSTEENSPKAIPASTGKINGAKYIQASKGTSLLAIATNNNINLAKLLDYNDLAEDGILDEDQIIYLEKKAKTGQVQYCVAGEGETMHSLSQKHGVQLQSLLEYNNMTDDDVLTAGKRVYLKPGTVAAVTKEATESKEDVVADNRKTHEVQPKEGLFSIAKKYGITVQQLRDWNNLENDEIKIGQQLIVSNR